MAGLFEHVVTWNALPFQPLNAVTLLYAAVLSFGAFPLLAIRRSDGRMGAYLAGALAVAMLGGREGGSINFLLDLCAASALALAPAARGMGIPLVLAAQLGVAALLFPAVDAHATTEPWQDVRRAALAADLDHSRPQLAEDSGILVANGIEPVVDDLFLWTRLVRLGLVTDTVTPRVERGEFASIIADVDLEQLDQATVFEQQRWRPALVDAILRHYALAVAVPGHYRYVPR